VAKTADGLTKSATWSLTEAPFHATKVGTVSINASASAETVYAIDTTVTLTNPEGVYFSDLTAKLYRAEVINNTSTPPVEATLWTQVGGTKTFDENSNPPSFVYTDPIGQSGLGKYYTYRVEIFTGTAPATPVIRLEHNANDASSKVQISTAYVALQNGSLTPIVYYNVPTTPGSLIGNLQVLATPNGKAPGNTILDGAQLFLYKADGTTEPLGKIVYMDQPYSPGTAGVAVNARGYVVHLSLAQINRLRVIDGYRFVTEYSTGEQKPAVAGVRDLDLVTETIRNVLGESPELINPLYSATLSKAGTPSADVKVYWDHNNVNNPYSWVDGTKLYYEDGGEYYSLGPVVFNALEVAQTTNTAYAPINSYCVTLEPNARAALNSRSSFVIYWDDLTNGNVTKRRLTEAN
jgi:hypothetical protein